MAGTSLVADHVNVSGLLLYVGTSGSPETMVPICNVQDWNQTGASTEVMVTNVSDTWVRRIPTLLDLGKPNFKVFWVMEEPTHRNSVGGGAVPAGLRYLWMNKLLRDWSIVYPDGNNSTDSFQAYVTAFGVSGKVGGVFEGAIALGTTGTPTLV